jgi:transporter family protein
MQVPENVIEQKGARVSAWLWLSLLTVLLWGTWGLQSKLVVDRMSPWMNQVLFPIGLLPVIVWAVRSRSLRAVRGSAVEGASFGLLTGVLGGAGNVAFFLAFSTGGKASIVTPLVGLAPLVTVILALFFLKERINGSQTVGLLLALASIYLLSA